MLEQQNGVFKNFLNGLKKLFRQKNKLEHLLISCAIAHKKHFAMKLKTKNH